MRHHLEIDWEERLRPMRWDHVRQLVIIPFAREPHNIVEEAVENLLQSQWPKERMIVVLAAEEAAGEEAHIIAEQIRQQFGNQFDAFLVSTHPSDLAGEIPGKGSNETWALRQSLRLVRDLALDPKDILISSFDVDTRIPSQYFFFLT